MWDLPGPGIKPVSPALAGGFLTTVPPGKSSIFFFFFFLRQPLFLLHRTHTLGIILFFGGVIEPSLPSEVIIRSHTADLETQEEWQAGSISARDWEEVRVLIIEIRMIILWVLAFSSGSTAQATCFPFESSSSSLPSKAHLIRVCRFNVGREGQLYPYIITVLWLSLTPEVLMQIKWETLEKEGLQLLHCPRSPVSIVNSYCKI